MGQSNRLRNSESGHAVPWTRVAKSNPYREDDARGPTPRRDSQLPRIARGLCFASALVTAASWASCGLMAQGDAKLSTFTVGLVVAVALWLTATIVQAVASARLKQRADLSGVYRLNERMKIMATQRFHSSLRATPTPTWSKLP